MIRTAFFAISLVALSGLSIAADRPQMLPDDRAALAENLLIWRNTLVNRRVTIRQDGELLGTYDIPAGVDVELTPDPADILTPDQMQAAFVGHVLDMKADISFRIWGRSFRGERPVRFLLQVNAADIRIERVR